MAGVKKVGGIAYKFTSPNRRSVPDRLVLWPGGISYFVECKATGRRLTEAQARECARIHNLGFNVYVVNSLEDVDRFIKQAHANEV